MTTPLPVVVDRRSRFSSWYWMTLGGLLVAVAVYAALTQGGDADRRNDDQKRYLLCIVDRTVQNVARPVPGKPCTLPTEAELAEARARAATATPGAQAFLAELDCRTRLAINALPAPAAGAPCVLPPSTSSGTAPPPGSPTTTTTTSPRSSAPASPSPSPPGGAGAPTPPVVLVSNPFQPPVTLPRLPVTIPPVPTTLPPVTVTVPDPFPEP